MNTQIAFISSMLITFASFISYKIVVQKRVEAGDKREYREFYDELEDRYNVFSEEDDEDEIKEVPKPKKRGSFSLMLMSLVSTLSGALSIYRVVAYAILFISIMYLIRHNLFHPIAFFVGLSVVPLVSAVSGVFLRRD